MLESEDDSSRNRDQFDVETISRTQNLKIHS